MSIDSMGVTSPPAQRAEAGVQIVRPGSPATQSEKAAPQRSEVLSTALRADDGQKQSAQPNRQEVDEAVNRLSKFVSANQSEINFSVDEASGIRVVKIVDRSSNEVIRQMPSEEAVALAQALDKLQGLLIKDKA